MEERCEVRGLQDSVTVYRKIERKMMTEMEKMGSLYSVSG